MNCGFLMLIKTSLGVLVWPILASISSKAAVAELICFFLSDFSSSSERFLIYVLLLIRGEFDFMIEGVIASEESCILISYKRVSFAPAAVSLGLSPKVGCR